MKRWVLLSIGVAVFAVRAKPARQAYLEEVTGGARPIEGVATAVAAFVGLASAGTK